MYIYIQCTIHVHIKQNLEENSAKNKLTQDDQVNMHVAL